jgi:hypothetical protein
MSDTDNDTIPPEADDQLRARLRTFAREVTERVDTEDALEHLPRPTRLPTTGLMAIAATLLVVVGLAAIVVSDRRGVDTIDVSNSGTSTTDCPTTTRPRIVSLGGQMNKRFALPVASAAAAILLFGGCDNADADPGGVGGPRVLARGNVQFVGEEGLGGNKMDINAAEQDGKITGEARFNEIVVAFECADTDTNGVVILGGKVTTPSVDNSEGVGELAAVIIREGDPDRVSVWFDDATSPSASCADLLRTTPDDLPFHLVEDGYDIETG